MKAQLNTASRPSGYFNVGVLAVVSAVAMAAFPLLALMGSILGALLSPSPEWATLPVALMVIGTAMGILPVAKCMAGLGRKTSFLVFMALGTAACLLAGQALQLESFSLFCSATFLLGVSNAAMQQVRFAAMESVSAENGPTAVSIIMCAGIFAAFVGPELAVAGRHFSAVEYQGSFWLAAACLIAGAIIMMFFYRTTAVRARKTAQAPRPLGQIISNPTLILAVASGAAAYMVMSLVMTATPITMHLHHGYSIDDTKWVIQSHIAAMFLPSLLTIWLFRLFSIRGMMIAGLVCFCVTIGLGLYDSSVMGFWGQLVLLGIGWNFLFVSGTALLPSSHREGEHIHAQAFNDAIIFSTQAVAALSAGWAVSIISWQQLLLLCLLPMLFIAGLLVLQRKKS
jgi:MFS family permease